jgi:hypothetical protein
MPSVETQVKQQFAKLFRREDWELFKRMADHYFRSAAFLHGRDLNVATDLRLLVRNCQKRLFIGIGAELLLKAIYLKSGFCIDKPERGQADVPHFPFTFQEAAHCTLEPDRTYMLNDLVDHLAHVPGIGAFGVMDRGLRIAKVFRKQGGPRRREEARLRPGELPGRGDGLGHSVRAGFW